ncbi:hypothetical protein GCM10028798_32230 [Humibacter antri]
MLVRLGARAARLPASTSLPVVSAGNPTHEERTLMEKQRSPWPALWALVIGFFMILVDTTIVSVANPKIMEGLNTDINSVIWVTSAYLLAYAVPLLVTGRLGDRFGPKNMYLIGLVLFTGASLWCGLSGSIELLIVARVVQGLGAALMTPQTMAVITRTFPPNKRGAAMALWGATSGVAMLVGPLLGGVLVDGLGWEWIFFINVPVGSSGSWRRSSWCRSCRRTSIRSTSWASCSARSVSSSWCSASRRARSTTGARSPDRSRSGG